MNGYETVHETGERLRCYVALGPLLDPESAARCADLVAAMQRPAPPSSMLDRTAAELIRSVHWWFGPAHFESPADEMAARLELLRQVSSFEREVAEGP